ncbi:MerR family transcriptional regulator [Bacillus cereus group sp. BfR-BA-01119]|uniref:MerR family transcriptional regulator n=1 Tax=Bacillus cereus group TaxID=86661 RepID=UPI000BF80230|nr:MULTISPECIES: MerR family transcriptional regulator [Bacillus cereus group]PFU36547.1 MerR family transcriptional regulator [Bacillus cereus]MCU5171802.1 MerR family transcriptional regulator [Bacillus paranthracis]MDA2154514.1 MerR family transcriptional regulator [Bacillus cereus group sp. Bc253]MDX5866746.1 MerR family transcriptional regulator [Bacillus cereus group sp. BfR-BA-01119]MDX5908944.1 MerR family transcriptional regulator [Bacillus cereus group sp. BfR-BA-01029]
MAWMISEFASVGDVTVRTLRYYDKINLLKPSDYTEGGHRLYTKDDLYVLQQIQSFKHLGFSLSEIQNIILQRDIETEEFLRQMHFQRKLLLAEQERIAKVLLHMDEMTKKFKEEERVDVALFSSFLQTFIWEKENKEWLEEHFSNECVQAFYSNKEVKEKFDRRFMDVIGKLKKYQVEEKDPGHQDVQVTLKEFFNLIEEVTNYLDIPQSDIEDIIKQSKIPLDEFPALFTSEEEQYIKEAMNKI